MDGLPLSSLEQGDDLGDPFSKAWEKGIGWLIDEPQGMFVERYLRGDMAIVLRLREPAGSGETILDGLRWTPFVGQSERRLKVTPCRFWGRLRVCSAHWVVRRYYSSNH